MRLHHYGFATKSILKSAETYQKLGFTIISEIIEDTIQNVKLLFLQKQGETIIELVEPLSDKSPVTKILEKNGSILYHSCYEVDDIELMIKELRSSGFIMIVNPVRAVAFENRLICFLYNQHVGLIELLEK